MFRDFKFFGTSRSERFVRGLIFGTLAALVIGTAYGALMYYTGFPIEFQFVIMLLGFAVAYVIRYTTHGVQKQFSILAAVLTVLCIIIADMVTAFGFNIFNYGLFFCLRYTISSYFVFQGVGMISAMLRLVFRALAVVYAYHNGRLY